MNVMAARHCRFVRRLKIGVSVAATLAVGAFVGSAAAVPAHLGAGDLDRSFGDDGKVVTAFRHGHARPTWARVAHAHAVLLDSKNRIVAVGSAARKFAVARYKPNGHLDDSFSHNGKVETDVSRARLLRFSYAEAGAIDARGRIIAVGTATVGRTADDQLALVAYNSNGRLDRSFGHRGEVRTTFSPGPNGQGHAVAIDDRGRIVVAGDDVGGQRWGLARFMPNGNRDRSFGVNGRVLTSGNGEARSVAIDSQGRIIVGGYMFTDRPRKSDFTLVRYLPDGTIDDSFGVSGKVMTDFGGADEVHSIAVDSSDRIVAGGVTAMPRGGQRFALARYTTHGSLDPSFGDGGKVITGPEDGRSAANAVVIDARGHVIAAGGPGRRGNRRFEVVRYTSSGALDPTFSGNGRTAVKFGSGQHMQTGQGAVIDSKQRIVVAGYAGDRFALARLLGRNG